MSTLTDPTTTRHESAAPPAEKRSDARLTYVYLTSVEHSGSTLVSCLYDAHPEATSIGEFAVNHSPDLNCPCGSTVSQCEYWREWKDRAEAAGYDFQFGNLGINLMPQSSDSFIKNLYLHQFPNRLLDSCRDLALSWSQAKRNTEQAIEKSIGLARILCDMEGINVFVDTSKNPLQIRHLAKRKDIDFKMIGLIRDGRAVMKSVIEKEGYSTEQAIGAWTWGIKHMRRAMRYVSEQNRLLLRLEDLCESPEATLEQLYRFAGLDPTASLDFSLSHRHLTGNRMRHKFDGKIRPHDESWREYLGPDRISNFEQHAGNINRSLGYQAD